MKRKGMKADSSRKIYAVDLFCGVGGLTNGLEKADICVQLGIDIDPACKYPYTTNNKARFLLKSIEELKANDVKKGFRKNGINLLAGCAPCQTFSSYNQKATSADKRWWLLLQFSRLVKETDPHLVTMENVPKIKESDVFRKFVDDLMTANYFVTYDVVNCADYGVPQQRQRLVLLASKFGPVQLLSSSMFGAKPVTVRESISEFPPLEAGGKDDADPLHQACSLSDVNLTRIKSSRPGGTWRDWEQRLIAECHRKSTGKTYPSVYGRMSWDEPAPTITTQFYGFGNGRFGHPDQHRAISLREGAVLQGFPREYMFVPPNEPIRIKLVGRFIGNAVPVPLGELIGKSLHEHVQAYFGKAPKGGAAESIRGAIQ